MRLTDFHSSGTVCSPTRAGLLTGRYQQRAGIEAVIHPNSDHLEHRKGLQRTETTFAELLQSAGYATGIIGKWHQGYPQNSEDYHPQNHGFDQFIGYQGNIDFVSHVGDHNLHDWWHGREETHEVGYTTYLVNRYTEQFIRQHANNENHSASMWLMKRFTIPSKFQGIQYVELLRNGIAGDGKHTRRKNALRNSKE